MEAKDKLDANTKLGRKNSVFFFEPEDLTRVIDIPQGCSKVLKSETITDGGVVYLKADSEYPNKLDVIKESNPEV
jgi:hypothetical protein